MELHGEELLGSNARPFSVNILCLDFLYNSHCVRERDRHGLYVVHKAHVEHD